MNVRLFVNDKTPADILFPILVKLDIKQLLLWSFIIEHFQKTAEENSPKSVFKQHSFWKENAENYLSPQQLSGITDYKKLRLARYNIGALIEPELNKFNFSNWIFRGKYKYRGVSRDYFDDVAATFEEIRDLIVQDKAEELFTKFMGDSDFLLEIKKDNYDRFWVREYLQEDQDRLLDQHLHFIGLIKCMMEVRAFKCFELFLRTSMILYSSMETHAALSSTYRAGKLRNMIFESQDEYFHKRYIFLAIKLLKYTCPPFESIQYAIDHNYSDVLGEAINSLDELERNDLFAKCAKPPLLKSRETLERYCYPKLGSEEKLNEFVKAADAIKINNQNLPESLEKISNLRAEAILFFGQWEQSVKDKYSLQRRSDNQTSNVNENKEYVLTI